MLADSETLSRAVERPGALTRHDAMRLMAECPTEELVSAAGRVRDLARPGGIVTYSRKVFINLVNLCRDTCSYCTYKKEPGDPMLSMLGPGQVLAIAEAGRRARCTEALFVTGERPEQKYGEARSWLSSLGHSSTVDYIREMSELVLAKTGLLPHTNAGSMTKKEMAQLRDTNVSMGVMLETSSERLMGRGMAHEGAPSKNPKVRIKTLESAGELKIPMTTGILAGIGETPEELVDSLFVIKELHEKHGHIQEVILQNFEPKPDTGMANFASTPKEYFLRAVAVSRLVMPAMNIQVPPNLNPAIYGRYIDAGINDWGGISPVTIDHVNPEFPWPTIESVKQVTEEKGKHLRARLPVYPEYLEGGFISERLEEYVRLLSDHSGLVKEEYLGGA
ncbi:7,8-didemethyl-8-hydroxy-5-deazariboflavin synthase CofG [Nitrososphaera viennensis]|uniref:7,8-didemethyl-8-hydroxy-5-deazariboflavin synthase n=2 Tax=Nitrososphaera viennensis TaxID=1034015 RepID=A0A060HJA1_9ARCH|nr:7,8-didemethyl-8-hydroxy-5-deazariboflavin synthase CofG [Nitrososphaera viennensis]AIC15360.1 FO synthase subunit 1 [Nitrososphaera viennensis EN76]UVS70257.1 7,8-didemethyl-8-hydroxy-5-deazariboflavin synthase CofG [Nitrososphaera viennensis]